MAAKEKSRTGHKSQSKRSTRSRRIDWELVMRDFRMGGLSQTQLARKHGIANETISRKIKSDREKDPMSWRVDLAGQIRDASDARLAEIALAEMNLDSSIKSAVVESISTSAQRSANHAVLAAAEVVAQTSMRHQREMRELSFRASDGIAKLTEMANSVSNIREAGVYMSGIEAYARVRKMIVEVERKILRMDEPETQAKDSLDDLLREIRS